MKKTVTIIILLVIIVAVFFLIIKRNQKVVPVEVPIVEVNHKVIGTSVEGRNIEAYKYGTGSTHLLFVGGIHGGYEWNSTALAYTFMDYLKANPSVVPANITVDVIPSANPDGLYKVVGNEGRFNISDTATSTAVLASVRFNANQVDLNRNFNCKWKPESTWQAKKVSAGTAPFSEPEALTIKNFILETKPSAVIFWHSQSNAVYASQCEDGILSETLDIMKKYSDASGYPAVKEFSAYETTGAADDWLASIHIPAITVELKTHETVEWEKNLLGIKAIFDHYSLSK